MRLEEADPKGLIRESYLIDGISLPECRSIFLDWAISLAPKIDQRLALKRVISEYAVDPAHPMTSVLHDGLNAAAASGRRGGRRARVGMD